MTPNSGKRLLCHRFCQQVDAQRAALRFFAFGGRSGSSDFFELSGLFELSGSGFSGLSELFELSGSGFVELSELFELSGSGFVELSGLFKLSGSGFVELSGLFKLSGLSATSDPAEIEGRRTRFIISSKLFMESR